MTQKAWWESEQGKEPGRWKNEVPDTRSSEKRLFSPRSNRHRKKRTQTQTEKAKKEPRRRCTQITAAHSKSYVMAKTSILKESGCAGAKVLMANCSL